MNIRHLEFCIYEEDCKVLVDEVGVFEMGQVSRSRSIIVRTSRGMVFCFINGIRSGTGYKEE